MITRGAVNQPSQSWGRELRYLAVGAMIVLLVLLLNLLGEVPSTFPESWNLGLREPVDEFQKWTIRNRAHHPLFTWFFDPLSNGIDLLLRRVESFLVALPWFVIVSFFFLLGQRANGLRTALLATTGLLYLGAVGLWDESMQTLALMIIAVSISLLIGIPLGIWAALNDRVERALRPLLDAMQTMPAFVYLIPVILFFGVARVPAIVATVIYALPPAIRLTTLGIREVPRAALEAAEIFGSTRRQILLKIQLPLALPTILTGVNQTIMMALSIVVIAALIGAGGLGREVLLSLQRLQVGRGLEAGLAIVALAILLDRIGASLARGEARGSRPHWQSFRLLPGSWDRFGWATAIEQGLDAVATGLQSLADLLARALARPLGAIARLAGGGDGHEHLTVWLIRHAYWIGSGLLLLALWLLGEALGWRAFPETLHLDMRSGIDTSVRWMRDNLYQIGDLPIGTGPFSDAITLYALNPLRRLLTVWLPWPIAMLVFTLIALDAAGWRNALFTAVSLFLIGLLGMWELSMDTLSQTIVAVLLAVLIGIPLGIWSARSDRVEMALHPILDTFQTIPSFVFLVPVIMLFNVGRVPGIIASVIYALPPAVRLTALGIRQVSPQAIEAAQAFGSTSRQMLLKVQLPMALPSIMMGVNQTVMMVLAMVIIAGIVGGSGLGLETVSGLARNEPGRGLEAGLAIVLLAMVLDRITQGWAERYRVPEGH